LKQETLARLIEGAGPEQLKAIARLALRLSGHAESRITDGPYDGGADLVVQGTVGNVLPRAVAVSVERDWRKKIRKDAEKVRSQLGHQHILFISSRRIPEGSFRTLQTELLDKSGLHVDRLDQQGIADLVMEHDALAELLAALDIAIDASRLPTRPADRNRDAAYAYAFFSPEVRSFHKAIRDRSLLVALSHSGGRASIDELLVDASRLLGMSIDDAPSLVHNIDRLRGQGRIIGSNGVVLLAESERATMDALRELRNRDELALRDELRKRVDEAKLGSPNDAIELLMRGLGALVARHIGAPKALEDLHTQVRRLRRELQALGLPEGARCDRFIEQAIELARESDLGRALAVGSVYQALTRLDRNALLGALDAQSIAFVLDASVAIPMLCALFHGSVQQRFFVVAEELHRRSQRAGIPLKVPDVWLEEMASHLLNARDYVAFVGDEDLRQSRNAYVAYFHAGRRMGREGDFDEFLANFGLTKTLGRRAAVDYTAARRELEVFLRRQLSHYGVDIVSTSTDPQHLVRAAKDWAWACHELGIEGREPLLQDHDRRVLAWLSATTENDPKHAPLIVTWDRVLRAARPDSTPGGALDPLATSELLSFVAGTREPPITARFASLELTEIEAENGAAILDALIALERSGLSDAALAQKAQAFKRKYLNDQELQASAASLERAWRAFQQQ
jgi:hypothetical protein